jgi:hypothetical protein
MDSDKRYNRNLHNGLHFMGYVLWKGKKSIKLIFIYLFNIFFRSILKIKFQNKV